jgi:predicted ATPase
MALAKLVSVEVERFKSYLKPTKLKLAPLTIILGRNNSGKSTLIQALLLLKQTLVHPRTDVPLRLEGMIDALSLRELTYGWPAEGPHVAGPRIAVTWESRIDVREALEAAKSPERGNLADKANLPWIATEVEPRTLRTELSLDYIEIQGRTVALDELVLRSMELGNGPSQHNFRITRANDGSYSCHWNGELAGQIGVEFDHFLPFLTLDRRNIGPRDRQRAWHNAYTVLFAQPLDDLKRLLLDMGYLGSMRSNPLSLYRPETVAPDDIGMSGERAAQMLQARKTDVVHYLPPIVSDGSSVTVPDEVRAQTLEDAVNDIFSSLEIRPRLRVEDIREVGFKLLFGQASLQHVGRGLSYLLPVIQLGLISDPLRFNADKRDMRLAEYLATCEQWGHCLFEEPEAHLHPKLQSRLAHWFVALAHSGRLVVVETHSDHFVRRLRRLAALAPAGSTFERWMLDNVVIVEVEQDAAGASTLQPSRLTAQGGLGERWPVDFMDEAPIEERAIFDAALDKPAPEPGYAEHVTFEDEVGPEPES